MNQRGPNTRLQRTRRPRLRAGRSLRSLVEPLKRRPLGAGRSVVPAVLAYTVLFGVVGGLFGQPVSVAKQSPNAVEPALQVAMAERQKASLEGDTQKIELLMAPEYVQTDIGGRVQNKGEWLSSYLDRWRR